MLVAGSGGLGSILMWAKSYRKNCLGPIIIAVLSLAKLPFPGLHCFTRKIL